MFKAGAGNIHPYDHCCWQTEGTGQFRPLPGSNPHIGSENLIEQVNEWKVEIVCDDKVIHEVIQALKAAHPYETPAYLVFKSCDF